MLPGTGPAPLKTSTDPNRAPIIEGVVAPDPANALVAATATLESINKAASGIATVTKKAEGIDQLLVTWRDTGEKLGSAAAGVDRVIKTNENNLQPAIDNFRQFAENANKTFDPQTQAQLKTAVDRFATASAKLDSGLTDLQPFVKDLGAPVKATPTTNMGWGLLRFNRTMYDLNQLSRTITNDDGSLNTNGSLQRIMTRPELYNNMNNMAIHVGDFFAGGKLVLKNFNTFAEKIARDPAAISRGVLQSK
jgi:phospholipid/cholesterol/gamma-HCH transport system substrate-binding protein